MTSQPNNDTEDWKKAAFADAAKVCEQHETIKQLQSELAEARKCIVALDSLIEMYRWSDEETDLYNAQDDEIKKAKEACK